MKSPSNRRSRGRGGNSNRRSPQNSNNPNRSYESSGGGTRVRGNAQQLYEKYTALSRDAQSAGDHIGAENYAQHAEHYFRLMQAAAAARAEKTEQGGRRRRQDRNGGGQRGDAADAPQPRSGAEDKAVPVEENAVQDAPGEAEAAVPAPAVED